MLMSADVGGSTDRWEALVCQETNTQGRPPTAGPGTGSNQVTCVLFVGASSGTHTSGSGNANLGCLLRPLASDRPLRFDEPTICDGRVLCAFRLPGWILQPPTRPPVLGLPTFSGRCRFDFPSARTQRTRTHLTRTSNLLPLELARAPAQSPFGPPPHFEPTADGVEVATGDSAHGRQVLTPRCEDLDDYRFRPPAARKLETHLGEVLRSASCCSTGTAGWPPIRCREGKKQQAGRSSTEPEDPMDAWHLSRQS